MTRADWASGGAFIPFPMPVPFPDSDVEETPTVCLRFNEDWLPWVLGALKVLARSETWASDVEGTDALVEQGHRLLSLVEDPCNPIIVPFYLPYVSALDAGSYDGDLFSQYWRIDNPSEPDPEFRIVLVGAGAVGSALDITVRFARVPENCDVSPFLSRLAISSQNGIGYAYVLTLTDAFGTPEVISDFLPFERTDFELQEFNLVLGSDAATVTITMDLTGDLFADCA